MKVIAWLLCVAAILALCAALVMIERAINHKYSMGEDDDGY